MPRKTTTKPRVRKVRAPFQSRVIGDLKLIPVAILERYPGKHIVYSDQEHRVIGVADTLAEAFRQAAASGAPEPWHTAYSDSLGTDGYVF